MTHEFISSNRFVGGILLTALFLALVEAPVAFAQRTPLKPGMNFFSPQQDVELGRQVAQDAEKKIPMLNNARVDDYLNRLGKRLATVAPGEKFPYQFKCVNDSTINAFALPGGFLYINRGVIEAADNEAELAGVIGHEIGHVALRHGTNQASKSYLAQAPLAILSSVIGSNSVPAILAQIGTSFTANSILLKYSRDDERQADLLSAQILYDAGYDPRYVASFFQKLDSGGRGSDFFSSHPNPENRIKNINAEIARLGSIPADATSDRREFREIQNLLKTLPPAPKADAERARTTAPGRIRVPDPPSRTMRSLEAGDLSLRHPDNWKVYENGQTLTLTPEGGLVGDNNSAALAYGMVVDLFVPERSRRSGVNLTEATDQLIESMRRSNPNMRVSRDQGMIRVGGKSALSKVLTNDSPLGGRETIWLVTTLRSQGLLHFVCVAPEQEFKNYQAAFQQVLNSVRFAGQ